MCKISIFRSKQTLRKKARPGWFKSRVATQALSSQLWPSWWQSLFVNTWGLSTWGLRTDFTQVGHRGCCSHDDDGDDADADDNGDGDDDDDEDFHLFIPTILCGV